MGVTNYLLTGMALQVGRVNINKKTSRGLAPHLGCFPPPEAKLQEVDRTANEAAENNEDYDDLGRCQAVEVLKRRCGWQVVGDGLVGYLP